MELKVGGKYRTRDGRKAGIESKIAFKCHSYIGWTLNDDVILSSSWTKEGIFDDLGDESDCDLVAEWSEPKPMKTYYRVTRHHYPKDLHYIFTCGEWYPTKEQAIKYSLGAIIDEWETAEFPDLDAT